MDVNALISNIRVLMAKKVWNQADLSRNSGVLRVSISNILNGKTVPTLPTIEKFAAAFGVTTDQLINSANLSLGSVVDFTTMSPEKAQEWVKNSNMDWAQVFQKARRELMETKRVGDLQPNEASELLQYISGVPVRDIFEAMNRKFEEKQDPALTGPKKELFDLIEALDQKLVPRALTILRSLTKASPNDNEDGYLGSGTE